LPRATRSGLTVLALLTILAIASLMRLPGLEAARSNFPDLFDEGIRAEQLLLMAQGFRPYRDIYAAQGPLLLDTLYPFYRAFGESLGAVRLGVGVLSLVGLVGAFLTARQVGGLTGGLFACALLALSPAYLEGSRLALAEVPSLAPATLSIAAALRYQAGAGRAWLIGSALLLGIALLLKPMVVAAAVPIGLAILLRSRLTDDAEPLTTATGVRARRIAWDLGLYAAVIAALTAVVVAVMGPREVFEQLVVYRAGATGASGWEARASWKEAVQGPISAHRSLYILAAAGAVLLLRRNAPLGAPLIAWPLASFVLLFFYTPLHPKHLVYLAPPAAILAGAGLGVAWTLVASGSAATRIPVPARVALACVALALIGWNLVAIQPVLAQGVQPALEQHDLDLHVFDGEAAKALRAIVPPDQFVVTDHPYIAFLASRMVPPELVDPSRGRARAGTLTDDVAARAATDRDAQVVLFWADRLRRLGKFNAWVEQRYEPIASFGTRVARNKNGKDRTVYLRHDADLAAARQALVGGLDRPLAAEFAGDLRLLGATITAQSVARGEPFAVSLAWESLRHLDSNYHVILSIHGPDGGEYSAQEQDIEGTEAGTRGWTPGAWRFRSFMVVPEAECPSGEYRIVVGLDNTRGGRPAPVTANPDRLDPPRPDAVGRLVVGTIQVH
jgi:hypothetical protein